MSRRDVVGSAWWAGKETRSDVTVARVSRKYRRCVDMGGSALRQERRQLEVPSYPCSIHLFRHLSLALVSCTSLFIFHVVVISGYFMSFPKPSSGKHRVIHVRHPAANDHDVTARRPVTREVSRDRNRVRQVERSGN